MTPPFARRLNFDRGLLLAALAVAAVAGPVPIALLHASRSRAQTPKTSAPLSFEVASVKLSIDQDRMETRPTRSGGRIRWNTQISYLVQYAYHLENWRVSGPGEQFIYESIYTIDATMDPATTSDQVCQMFRSLLADRFKMVAHRVAKKVDGYALTIAKGGLKIGEAKPEDKPAPWPDWMRGSAPEEEHWVSATLPEAGIGAITGRRASMLQLSATLQRLVGGMVADQTGLPGEYYFAFRYSVDDNGKTDASSLSAGLKNPGLKLEKWKGPVEMLVIDHIEQTPTGN